MWLNESLNVPDPYRTSTRMSSVAMVSSGATGGGCVAEELAMMKMELDLARTKMTRMSEARPSARLASVAQGLGGDAEDLRRKVSTLEREKEKWKVTEDELNSTKRQITDLKLELAQVTELHDREKSNSDSWRKRVDEEAQLRRAAETALHDSEDKHADEMHRLRTELLATRRDNTKLIQEAVNANRSDMEEKTRAMDKLTATLRSEAATRNEKLTRMSAENEGLRDKIAELQASISEVTLQNESLQTCFNDAVANLDKQRELALEEQRNQYQEQMNKVLLDAATSQKEMETRRTQSLQLKDEVAAATKRISDMRSQLSSTESQLSSAHDTIDRQRAENDKLRADANTLRQQLRQSSIESEELASKLRAEITDRTEEVANCTSTIRALQTSLADSQRAATELQAECEQKLSLYNRLIRQNEELREEYEAVKEEVDATSNNALHALKAREDEIDDLKSTIEAMRSRIQSMEQEHGEAHSKWARDKMELMKTESDNRRELARVNREVDDLKERERRASGRNTENHSHQLFELRAERDGLHAKLADAQNEIELLQEKLSAAKCDLGILRAQQAVAEQQALNRQASEDRRQLGAKSTRRAFADISNNNSPEPVSRKPSHRAELSLTNINSQPLMSQILVGVNSVNNSLSRNASVSALANIHRVFAITGFDDKNFGSQILSMPNAEVMQLKPNAPIPNGVTHLITNGSLTMKLFGALVKGCWVLPKSYVDDSVERHQWADESQYGFRHTNLPLLSKTMAFSPKFKTHLATTESIASEGGAKVVPIAEHTKADYVMCVQSESEKYGTRATTWEQLVSLLYPKKVSEGTPSEVEMPAPTQERERPIRGNRGGLKA